MNKKNKLKALAGTGLALSMLLSPQAGPVFANEEVPTQHEQTLEISKGQQLKQAIEFFDNYGIEKQVQAKLIEKFNKGILWDSLKEDVKPTSIKKVETLSGYETVETFEDGSIAVVSVESEAKAGEDSNLFSPLGVQPGTITTGSGYASYKKAKVYYTSGVATAQFYVDFTILSNDWDKITYAYQPTVWGGDLSYFVVLRSVESSTLKAAAELKYRYIYNGTTYTKYLRFWLGNNTYGETH